MHPLRTATSDFIHVRHSICLHTTYTGFKFRLLNISVFISGKGLFFCLVFLDWATVISVIITSYYYFYYTGQQFTVYQVKPD